MKQFSAKLTAWYLRYKRDLPWRDTKDPYLIWLSEIILQQTRVDQGMAYYLRFASEFPTVRHLAAAENDRVMKLWQGLGYYSRARNLHATAKMIATEYKGVFPDSYDKILSLKGIGEYTASAIASFAFGQSYAVVDGNVYRVLSRIFGIETPIDSKDARKEFSILARELMNKKDPATHNQAIMEFGALQCKPVSPDCASCIFSESCCAYRNKKVALLPLKEKKTKVRNRYFNYIVLEHKGKTVINKRTGKDIWTDLYDFPLIETSRELRGETLLSSLEWKKFFGSASFVVRSVSAPYKHILSHQKIHARFWEVETTVAPERLSLGAVLVIKSKEIGKYAVPRLIENYLGTRK